MSRFEHRRARLRAGAATRTAELRSVGRRTRQVGVLAVVTGVVTGLLVAAFDRLFAIEVLERVIEAPLAVQLVAPLLGLVASALLLRWRRISRSTAVGTADEYIKAFHDPEHGLDLEPVPARMAACATTLGSGVALGFEGPAIYVGASVGTWFQRRFSRSFSRADAKLLLVCGAAAGVAAIFKAPATGLVFALEVPYRQDLARRMLLPAMFASAASYLVFVAVNGTEPLFPVGGSPPFDLRDLLGAAVLGLLCGAAARGYSRVIHATKHRAAGHPIARRIAIGSAVIAATLLLSVWLTDEPLSLGSGWLAIEWSIGPDHPVAVALAVFVLRLVATAAAVFASGVGGLFVVLAAQGALLGTALGEGIGTSHATLFPLLGVAAFLGAGYRVPLAAVVFVAETTGRPGFVVPGLIAAACSQLLVGRSSAAEHQEDTRVGLLEQRLALPVTAALRTDAATAPSDSTVAEVFDHHVAQLHLRRVPVVDGATFRGIVPLERIAKLDRAAWATTSVQEVLDATWPTGQVGWTLGDAIAAMEAHDLDRLPILDGDAFVGVVTTGEILKLEAILDSTDGTVL